MLMEWAQISRPVPSDEIENGVTTVSDFDLRGRRWGLVNHGPVRKT
jgi:hypothetical protein